MLSTEGLWVIVGVVAIGLVGLLILGNSRRRRVQLTRLSAALGLTLESDDSELRASGVLELLLPEATASRCRNVLRGEVRGAEALLFDYAVNDGHRWRPSDPVVCFHPHQSLPRFDLRPRASSKAPRGLELDTNPKFSELYALTGNDDTSLCELFQYDVLDFFERAENQGWVLVSTNEWLATAFWPLGERKRLLAPKEVLGFFEDAKEVLFLLTTTAQPERLDERLDEREK